MLHIINTGAVGGENGGIGIEAGMIKYYLRIRTFLSYNYGKYLSSQELFTR